MMLFGQALEEMEMMLGGTFDEAELKRMAMQRAYA